MSAQRLKTGFLRRPTARGNRSQARALDFERFEPRKPLACDATIYSNWDTYGNGVAHTGYVAGSIGTQFKGEVAWSREGFARTVIHDDLVYSFRGNQLRAIDLQTGVDLWTRAIGGWEPFGVQGGHLTFDSGNLYFVGKQKDYSLLYSVNATTGETNWTQQIAIQVAPEFPPVVAHGMVFVQGGSYGGLYGVNQSDGSGGFFVSISDYGSWSPAISNGRLYTWAGNLFAERSMTTGEALWSIEIDKGQPVTRRTNSALVISDGRAYIVGDRIRNNYVIAIDLASRSVIRNLGDYASLFSPAVAHGRVYVDVGFKLYQYGQRDSVVHPSYDLPSGGYPNANSQPIVTDDAVLKSAGDKTYIFDRITRKLRYTLPVGGELSLAKNTLLISSGSNLYAFSLCNGQAVTLSAPLQIEETGGVVQAKVSIGTSLPMNLPVQLTSSHPALLRTPSSVVIPAGQTSITFPLNALNNLQRQGQTQITITASAPTYLSSELLTTFHDDESAIASNVSDAWQEFNLGINRSGYYPGALGTYVPKQPEWSTATAGSALSISSDVIFAGHVGLDSHTGKQLWRNDSVLSGVNVDGELYYLHNAASQSRILYSAHAESGAIRWASEYIHAFPELNISVTDQWLLVGTQGGMFRVDRATGIVEDESVVAATRSTLYQNSLLVTQGNAIAALNLNDFSVRWKQPIELSWYNFEIGELTASNGRVAVNTERGLRVYDIQTGRELWRVDGIFHDQPAMDNDSLFAIQLGLVIQFDAATGRRVRTFEAGQRLTANQPIVTDDAIIVTSDERTFVFDRKTAQLKHWFPTGGRAFLSHDFLYLADRSGIKAYALNNQPALFLAAPELLREGDAPQPDSAQISIPEPRESDLVVTLHSNLRSRMVLPETVTIPAGQTSATFSIGTINDSFDNIQSSGYIQATAKAYRSSVSNVSIADDERPIDGSILGDWSMSGVDLARTGYVPGTVGTLPFPVVRWRNQLTDQAQFAIASRDQVFVQARRQYTAISSGPVLLAFDTTTGKLNWERAFEARSSTFAVTATDGHLYLTALVEQELHVLAIDQTNGELRWRYNYGKLPDSARWSLNSDDPLEIVVYDGIVLVPLKTIGLLALSQTSGERLYMSTFSHQHAWSPAIVNGRVFTWDQQTFREIDLRTGTELWKDTSFSFYSYNQTMPVVTDRTAVFTSQGRLVALDLNTRAVRWTFAAAIYEQLVVAGNKVFAAEYDLIRTFDLETGSAGEVYAIPNMSFTKSIDQLIVTDDAVIALAPTGDVLVFSRRTTELLWTFRGDSNLMNMAKDSLFLLGNKELVALSLRSASSYNSADVNGDERVTPLDALVVLNHLNQRTPTSNSRLDVNSDGSVTPLDALLVVNWLNRLSRTMSGEGESSDQPPVAHNAVESMSADSFFQSSSDIDEMVIDWTNLKRKSKSLHQH